MPPTSCFRGTKPFWHEHALSDFVGGEPLAVKTADAVRADPNPAPFFSRRDALQARDGYAMLFVGALLFWIPIIWPLGVISGLIGALLVLSGRRALGPENAWDADVASVLMALLGLGLAFVLGLFLG